MRINNMPRAYPKLKKLVPKILDCIICDKSKIDKKTITLHEDKESFEIYIPRDLRIIFYSTGHINFTSNLWYVSGFDFKRLSELLFQNIS